MTLNWKPLNNQQSQEEMPCEFKQILSKHFSPPAKGVVFYRSRACLAPGGESSAARQSPPHSPLNPDPPFL